MNVKHQAALITLLITALIGSKAFSQDKFDAVRRDLAKYNPLFVGGVYDDAILLSNHAKPGMIDVDNTASLSSSQFKVGAVGRVSHWTWRVGQILGKQKALVTRGQGTFMLKGYSTANWAVDDALVILDPVRFSGVQQYDTVSGGTNTVKVVEPLTEAETKKYQAAKAKADAANAKQQAIQERLEHFEKTKRTWTSKDGNFTLEASFMRVDKEDRKVVLMKRDGSEVRVDPYQLSRPDQTYYRQQVKAAKEPSK